jgi:hypothetical protein
MMRALGRAVALLLFLASAVNCSVPQALWAENADLADYRAFRIAAHEGVRLARAQRYLEAHPRGAWAREVHQSFDDEEPGYFQRASATRDRTREYLADLPHGPHAAAALALLVAFNARVEDIATERLLREARHTEATLDRSAAQRHALGEAILSELAALLDPAIYGASVDDVPSGLRLALEGPSRPSWGTLSLQHSQDFFYSIPTPTERRSSVASLQLDVLTRHGVIVGGRIGGPDLFVHWTEADSVRVSDPTLTADREAASSHAREILGGALEARLPAGRCDAAPSAPEQVIVRRCHGWSATVAMGDGAGADDTVVIEGPLPVAPAADAGAPPHKK